MEAIRKKWQQAAKVAGLQNVITMADGGAVSGRYYLVEVGSVTPSHDVSKGFAPSEGFPMDGGASCNDRDYFRDADAKAVTREIARRYDARAIQSPVVVSPDGVVLSGNGRTMAGELAAHDGTDGDYLDYLRQYCALYGFNAGQVSNFAHPRIVFVIDEALPYTVATFARFNARETKGQNKTEQAVKFGRLLPSDAFGRIVRTINGFETLGEFYANTEAATRCLNELRTAGVVDAMSYAEMFDGDTISTAGRETIENVLIGKAFEADGDASRKITAFKSLRRSVVFALAEVANNLTLSADYTLQTEIAQAVDLAHVARSHGYQSGERVSAYARQLDMFSGETVCDFTDLAVLAIADALNSEQVTLFKRILAVYNHQAADASAGQTDMFSAGGVRTKSEILEDVKTVFAKGVEVQREAVAEAVEARTAENVFISEEQTQRVMVGGFVEFSTLAGDTIICRVEALSRGVARLSAKGDVYFNVDANRVKPTADHRRSLPDWLQIGSVIENPSKRVRQRIDRVEADSVVFEWINGGYYIASVENILTHWQPSQVQTCEVMEAA